MTIWYVDAHDMYEENRIEDLFGPYKKYKKAKNKAIKLIQNHDYCTIYPHTNNGFGESIDVTVETETICDDYPREHKIHRTYVADIKVKEQEEIEYSCGWPTNYYVKNGYYDEGHNIGEQYWNEYPTPRLVKRDPNDRIFEATAL